jgi:hypothetical protein
VARPALVEKSKIYLPPLHIILALIKISVKVMDEEREEFVYLRKTFPKISETKMKEGIFVAPRIQQQL